MIAFNMLFAFISFALGALCIWNPFSLSLMIGYIAALFAGVWGIFAIISFFSNKKNRRASGFEAVMGFIGLMLGILGLLLFVFSFKIPGFVYTVEEYIIIFLLVFIGIEGFLCMISALVNISHHGVMVTVLAFILGLFMSLGSFVGFINLDYLLSMIGVTAGIAFIVNGIRLMVHCIE